jgi:hypothetical protein
MKSCYSAEVAVSAAWNIVVDNPMLDLDPSLRVPDTIAQRRALTTRC